MTAAPPSPARVPRSQMAVVCILAFVFALWRIVAEGGATELLEDRLVDLRFRLRGPAAPPDSVLLVDIDAGAERSGEASQDRRLADAVDRVAAAGPAVIALDLKLLESDAAGPLLAGAVARADDVVLGAALGNRLDHGGGRRAGIEALLERSTLAAVVAHDDSTPERTPLGLSLPGAAFAGGDALAHVNIPRSFDGAVRTLPLAVWIGGDRFLPAMSLEAARRIAGLSRREVVLYPGDALRLGSRAVPVSHANGITINHLGPPGTVPTVSLTDLIDGKVSPGRLAGRAVFFGAGVGSSDDHFATPYGADVPGTEIIATVAANLVSGNLIVEAPSLHALGALLAIFFAALAFEATNLARPAAALVAVPAVWLGGFGAVQLAFSEWRLLLDATTMLGALFFASFWTAARRVRAKRRLSEALEEERGRLSRYVPLRGTAESAADAVAEPRTREAAVLFVGVADFSALAESAGPERTEAFLAELHGLYERCAAAHGGAISGIDRDGALVVFGVPGAGERGAAAALAGARMLAEEAARFSSGTLPDFRLALRASVHFGPVAVAVAGDEDRPRISVTGDTVNLANRLHEIARRHGAVLVASRAALDAARRGGSAQAGAFVPLDDQPVPGRAERIEVWALPQPA